MSCFYDKGLSQNCHKGAERHIVCLQQIENFYNPIYSIACTNQPHLQRLLSYGNYKYTNVLGVLIIYQCMSFVVCASERLSSVLKRSKQLLYISTSHVNWAKIQMTALPFTKEEAKCGLNTQEFTSTSQRPPVLAKNKECSHFKGTADSHFQVSMKLILLTHGL